MQLLMDIMEIGGQIYFLSGIGKESKIGSLK